MVKGGLQAPDVEGQNPRRIRQEAVTPPHPEAVMQIGAGSQEGT